MGFKMNAGATGMAQVTLDPSVRANPGRLPINLNSVSGNYGCVIEDRFVECSASGGAATITLPAMTTVPGAELKILKNDSSSNTVTVAPSGSDTINGSTSSITLYGKNDSVTILSEANDWKILTASPNISVNL